MAIFYALESTAITDMDVQLFGMAYSDEGKPVRITVKCADDKGLISVAKTNRIDINKKIPALDAEYTAGFRIWIRSGYIKGLFPIRLVFDDGVSKKKCKITYEDAKKLRIKEGNVLLRYGKKVLVALRQEGVKGLAFKVKKRLTASKRSKDVSYKEWIASHEPDERALRRQKMLEAKMTDAPLISVVVPLYNTQPKLLRAMIESLLHQTYSHWELCMADGSENDRLRSVVTHYMDVDKRIRYRHLKKNGGISENTNAAIEMSGGKLIAFLDHDDTLAPWALYDVARAYIANPKREVIYSDQDKLSADGSRRYEPVFKSDFDPDFLRSVNYICHFLVVTRELLEKIGGLKSEYNGAQDYDFILRATEVSKRVFHIPSVLYHWRSVEGSTAANASAKDYAYEAGRKAVEDHCKRIGLPATVERTAIDGSYRVKVALDEIAKDEPLVSVIIPNKDLVSDLSVCLKSLVRQDYSNMEIIIVENNSEEKETFEYYETLPDFDSRIRVIKYEGSFNYSAINNFAIAESKGDYILLLNNDTEMIGDDVISEMLSVAARKEVGAVGAKLLYGDETIQHAGVIVGYGVADHAFSGYTQDNYGYENRIVLTHRCSAVTAACLMTKRSVFDEVGGLDEGLAVCFNDVDFCLKLRKKGYAVVYDAFATAHHYESKSRGYESDPAKVARINSEIARFKERWLKYFTHGDPYYNVNLNIDPLRPLYEQAGSVKLK